jgi:tetratricopeptide (TPR) repeat protein
MNRFLRTAVGTAAIVIIAARIAGALGSPDGKYIAIEKYIASADKKIAKGDWDGAIADYTKAIKLGSTLSYASRSMAKLNKKDFAGAIADCTEAIAQYTSASQPSRSQEDLDFLANLGVITYTNCGLAKKATGKLDEAITDFTKAYELRPAALRSPKHFAPDITLDLANAYGPRALDKINKQDWNGANTDFTKAIEFNPDFARAYYNRAYVRHQMGDEQGAAADRAKSVQLDPTLPH